MLSKCVQTSKYDIYTKVQNKAENNKGEFIAMLEKHIDFATLISPTFYRVFYKKTGRPHKHEL